jgi:diguanylate cyclase (GGDEF)-like protein
MAGDLRHPQKLQQKKGQFGDMPTSTSADILPEIQEHDIHKLLTESLYKQLPLALMASGSVAIVTLLVVWKEVPPTHLIGWALALMVISLLRYLGYRRFMQSGGESAEGIWYRRYFIGILLAGLIWGTFIWILPRDMATEYWIFVIFILGGMMAGSSSTSGAVLSGYLAFVLPICFSVVIWFFAAHTPFPTSMSMLAILYTLILIISVSHAGRTLRETFRLRFANVSLIGKLTTEQQNSVKLVEELRHEISRRASREEQLNDYNRLLEMLAHGEALPMILANLNTVVEKQLQGGMSSILMLDEEGKKLSTVSAPSLPDAYNNALQDQEIGSEVGSCGAAAYRNATVIAEDIETNPRWEAYRELALRHNLRACWSTPIRNTFGRVLGTLAIYHSTPYKPNKTDLDITMTAANIAGIAIEAKQTELRLQNMAHYDQLTQLPNRAFLYDRLAFIITQAKRRPARFAVLFIDLDNFKEINDSLGHEAGDRMLQSIAQGLKTAVRDSDIVSRFGGDEFVTLLMNLNEISDINAVIDKVLEHITQPYVVNQKVRHISGSIGISLFPDDGSDSDSLIQKADRAMYRAKEKGNHYVYFSDLDR